MKDKLLGIKIVVAILALAVVGILAYVLFDSDSKPVPISIEVVEKPLSQSEPQLQLEAELNPDFHNYSDYQPTSSPNVNYGYKSNERLEESKASPTEEELFREMVEIMNRLADEGPENPTRQDAIDLMRRVDEEMRLRHPDLSAPLPEINK